jgi:hypothetical protein
MDIQNKSFPTDFYHYLEDNTLTGIRAGKERSTFLLIWMVNVDGRIFARSWGKSKRSWFTTLLDEKIGQIKYGERVINITAVPCNDSVLNSKINEAYMRRYTTAENLPYAIGITQPEYVDFTMEFLVIE